MDEVISVCISLLITISLQKPLLDTEIIRYLSLNQNNVTNTSMRARKFSLFSLFQHFPAQRTRQCDSGNIVIRYS